MPKIILLIKYVYCFIFLFISIFIITATIWINNNFSGVTLEQIWFHLNVPDKNPTKDYFSNFIGNCLIFPIILTGALLFFSKDSQQKVFLYIKTFNLKNKIQLFPIPLLQRRLILLTTVLLPVSLAFFYKSIKVSNWFEYFFEQTVLYKDEYIDPKNTNIAFPNGTNNLILIYLESIESSMQSKEEGGIFNTNYIPELTQLAKKNINFSASEKVGGSIQVSFTGWTIGAIVASLNGLPLKIPIEGNSMGEYKSFMPRVTSLGDILEENNYNKTLMIGSDASFAGMENFFSNHGDFKIMDYKYFKEHKIIPEDYLVWWGVEDSKLYDFAKQEVSKLSKERKPFAFIMNTMDTHFPDGYLDNLADVQHSQQYANVISFASKQVNNFVNWIKTQPFYENTTIIILGDHLSMDAKFFKNIDGERYPYNCIINSKTNPIKTKKRNFSTYDWFPTIIESIGGEITSQGLGLGRSLLGKEETLLEKMGEKNFNAELNKNSIEYDSFWMSK